jgi:phenylacetate-CoA ligase
MRRVSIEDLLHPFLGSYMGSPRWLRASAGRAYSMLPTRVRLGGAYEAFREEIASTEGSMRAQELGLAKLEATLRFAIETVPAFQRHRPLLSGRRDPRDILARLPVTDKIDIKRHTSRYLSDAMPASARLEMYTGGSTRNPMQFFLQKHVSRPKEYAFIQSFRDRVGARQGELMLALRGRTVATAAEPHGPLWMLEPIKRQLILSSDHLEERYMPQYAQALATYRPRFVEAFPSALFPLARWLAEHPLPEFTDNVRGVMLYSENVFDFQMRKIREVFGCPIVKHYGQSERVLMAASLADDDRYFFWPQYGWLELLDAAGRAVRTPGEVGFVVGTSFDNQVMPFVRYRTGDLAMLSTGSHPSLPGYPACERIEGRLQEFIVCRDERLISITTLGVGHFPELSAVEAIQYEQHQPGEVVLKVVARPRLAPAQAEHIARAVREMTQGGCDVRVEHVDHIPRTDRGKFRMLVQNIDLRRYLGATAQETTPEKSLT